MLIDCNDWIDYRQVSEGRRPPNIRGCPEPLMDLIKSCWADMPRDRPTVDMLVTAIEALCYVNLLLSYKIKSVRFQIYPNRYVPLIDRTTNRQAFANPVTTQQSFFQPVQSFTPAPITPQYQQTYTTNNNTVQRYLPPIPPPPKFGHYRSGSHDPNNTQSSGFYSQPYSQAQTIVSQGHTINYNPMTQNPPPTPPMYRPSYNTPNSNRGLPLASPPQYMISQSLQVPAEINNRVGIQFVLLKGALFPEIFRTSNGQQQ